MNNNQNQPQLPAAQQPKAITPGTYWITGRQVKGKEILAGRKVEITKASKKPGYANGFLYHIKSGKLQATEIAIPNELLIPCKIGQSREEAEILALPAGTTLALPEAK